MESEDANTITVNTRVNLPLKKTWEYWTKPEHIKNWNFAHESWFCPDAKNELREGGLFSWRMEARDGSSGFDFCGTYDQIVPHKLINSKLDDGRKVSVEFMEENNETFLKETFEIEDTHSREQQRLGWQAILDNFKKYAENAG